MVWRAEWNALAARIAGLLEAGRFCMHCFPAGASAAFGVLKQVILPESQDVFESLRRFPTRHKSGLPVGAVDAFERFTRDLATFFNPKALSDMGINKQLNLMQHRLTALASFAAEITYQFSDTSASVKRLSDRAFSHLKRSLVADHSLRKLWHEAFLNGERACEKLGATHLLLHGIWAFKARSEGERTDLIIIDLVKGGRLDLGEAEQAAEALVLTEWKLVREKDNPEQIAQEAFRQASLYFESCLAGLSFVLDSYCYLVLVSQESCQMRSDFDHRGVRYCHINIAIEPMPPSRAARQTSKRITPRSTGRKPRKRGSAG